MTYIQVQRSLSGSLQTCENFAQLAKRGYYNGVVFHRIIAVRHDESKTLLLLTYCLFQRILWFRVAIRLGQVEEVPAYMDKSCTSHTHTSPLLHRRTDPNHPQSTHLFIPLAAKTRSIQTCGSQVPESSQWPTRDQTPTVRSFVRSFARSSHPPSPLWFTTA